MTWNNRITHETRRAWADNWKEHSVEEILEIFEYTRTQRLLKIFMSILPAEGKILEGGLKTFLPLNVPISWKRYFPGRLPGRV